VAISYFTTEAKRHWLSDVAEAAGLAGLRLPTRATFPQIRAAWAEVARTSRVTEEELARRVAAHFRLKVAQLDTAEPQCARLLPEELARKYGVLPMQASDQVIVVATCDPVSMEAEQDIQFLSGRQPVFQVAAPGPLLEALDRAYAREKIVDFVLQTLAAEAASDDVRILPSKDTQPSSAPQAQSIADLVKRMLRSAIQVGASAVHIDSEQDSGRVRFRVDGVLDHFMHLPSPALVRVVRRVKELGRLDVSTRTVAQEGQFRATVAGRAYRVRVDTHPAGSLERVRLTITCPVDAGRLDTLSFSKHERGTLLDALAETSGIVLVASPDRSERERVLNACTLWLRDQGRRAVLIESQLGFDLEGVEQVKVDPARGFPVAGALAATLEQPPDVIALERLDEPEAAALAIEAANRGLLVLAGVNASDLAGPLVLLEELGVDRGPLADALRAVVSVRFIRRLCDCAKPAQAPDDLPSAERALAQAFGVAPARRSVGCDRCRGTGFRGQIPVSEILRVRPATAQSIRAGESLGAIREGGDVGIDVRSSAHARAAGGETTLREIERVLGSSAPEDARPLPTTVLIVDDVAADRLLMRTLLEQKGYRVAEATGGAQALALLEREAEISLVLLDLLMPEMSGKEALRRIRGSVRTAGLPVIVLTAAEDPLLEIQLLESGADDYLGKPFDPSRLAVRVRAVLRRAGAYDADAGVVT